MKEARKFRVTRTADNQMIKYDLDPYYIKDRILSEKWERVGRTEEYTIEFVKSGAVYTVWFADYVEYILIIGIHKTTSRKKLKEVRAKSHGKMF